jgi:hypothetical protein
MLSQMLFGFGNSTSGNAIVDHLFGEPLDQGIDLYLSIAISLDEMAATMRVRTWQINCSPNFTQQAAKRIRLTTSEPLNRINQKGGNSCFVQQGNRFRNPFIRCHFFRRR